ncbi:MAG: hypothetical protein V3575_04915 [Candidatus Absconditabacteria bacterium]
MYNAYMRLDGRVREAIGANVDMSLFYFYNQWLNIPKIIVIIMFILIGIYRFKWTLKYDVLNDEYQLDFMKFLMFTSKYMVFIPGLCKFRKQDKVTIIVNNNYCPPYDLKYIRFSELEELTRNSLIMVIITTITFCIGILL